MTKRILVAGVGNIFLGDDAFGVEVAQVLIKRQLTDGVSVKDFGIRGFDLAYTLLDPWEAIIIVDALPRGEPAGTLYVIEPDLAAMRAPPAETAINLHSMDPVRVLSLAVSMGAIPAQVFVVGCEPRDFGDEIEGRMGLSPPVQAAVEEAANMIVALAVRILTTQDTTQLQTVER
jgi:hydrogenase maturation protease